MSSQLSNDKAREKYVGMVIETNNSGRCTVIDYHSRDKIIVRFTDGTEVKTTVSQICRKSIKNPNHPFVKGVGYVGVGEYSNKTHPLAHKKWVGLLERCYCAVYQSKKPTYIGCTVVDEWLCFQNFAKWFESQRCDKGWHLDKDLLVSGNKVYGPDFCRIVPRDVNMLTNDGVTSKRILKIANQYRYEIGEELYFALVRRSREER